MDEIAKLKEKAKESWAAGDYPSLAERIRDVGEKIVEKVQIRADESVLDVASGTGNASISAALAGGRVVGLDLTPQLLEHARAKALEAGVAIEWKEGDAESLPFPDRSFDVVLSTFGSMFAPRHQVTAAEMARVLRPGGRIGICAWTPQGTIGRFFRVMAGYTPPPPDFAQSPMLWGDEDHVREIFQGTGVDFQFERREVTFDFDSMDQVLDVHVTKFGALVMARPSLEAQGRWEALLDDLRSFYQETNRSRDERVIYPAEYLISLGRKKGE